MPTITKAAINEFNKVAYWDDIIRVWVYREDRRAGCNNRIMKHKGDTISAIAGNGYCVVMISGKQYYLHRLAYCVYHNIIDDKVILDHINGVRTDNSKENLRVSSHAHNDHNRIKKAGTSSQYIGVRWHKRDKKWLAHIRENGKSKHLGSFVKETDAARAYNEAAIKIYGDMAKLNELPEEQYA